MLRPVMMYGSEAWTVTRGEKWFLDRTEMRMLRWMLGVWLKKRNEVIRKMLRVACITDKIREARMRWYGHVMRRKEERYMKRFYESRGHRRNDRRRDGNTRCNKA